jgi:sulfur carrier protein ThiS
MKIRIELVGFLADTGLPGGYKGGEIELPPGATLRAAFEQLGVPQNTPVLLTINRRAAQLDQVLRDGDIVRLVPPISGG